LATTYSPSAENIHNGTVATQIS